MDRSVYLNSDFDAANTRLFKSLTDVELQTVFFGGGPPEKFTFHGNSWPVDWRTGQPRTDTDYIVCAHIQVVYALDDGAADRCLQLKATMAHRLGIHVHLCGVGSGDACARGVDLLAPGSGLHASRGFASGPCPLARRVQFAFCDIPACLRIVSGLARARVGANEGLVALEIHVRIGQLRLRATPLRTLPTGQKLILR